MLPEQSVEAAPAFRATYASGVVWVGALIFCLVWAGSWLILDAYLNRRSRPPLEQRLARFQPPSVSDEAQRWLKER